MTIGAGLALLPPNPLTTGLAVGSLLIGVSDLNKALGLIDEICNLLGIGVGVTEAGRLNDILGGELILVKDINKEVTVKASHRTIIASDVSSTNVFISSIFKSKEAADKIYSKTMVAIDKIKSLFGGNPPQMPPNTGNFNASSSLKVFPLLGRGITIDQVSNSALNVMVVSNNLLSITLKATGTSITAETPFTFRVNYTDPYTGISFNKTVDAIYKPVSYKLGLNLVNTTPVSSDTIAFGNDEGKFFVVLNEDNSPAVNIDYTKISVAGITNPNITASVQVGGTGTYGSFLLKLHSNQTTIQTTSLDVLYNSQKIQTINASVNDSMEIYKNLVLGNWSVAYYEGSGLTVLHQDNRLTLLPGGPANWYETWDINGNVTSHPPATPNADWSIEHVGNEYILHIQGAYGRITPSQLTFTHTGGVFGWIGQKL